MALNETNTLSTPVGERLFAAVQAGWARVAPALRDALYRTQVSRMRSALNGLSDIQLAEIGITRADIPARAEMLVRGEAAD